MARAATYRVGVESLNRKFQLQVQYTDRALHTGLVGRIALQIDCHLPKWDEFLSSNLFFPAAVSVILAIFSQLRCPDRGLEIRRGLKIGGLSV